MGQMPEDVAVDQEAETEEFIDIYRLKIRNDPKIITPRMYRVLKNGRYEATEAKLARRYLNADDTLLEFGSGLGVVAAIAIKRAKVKKVVSVEANPDLLPIIRDTLGNSGVAQDKCELIYGAVSLEMDDELTFYRRGDFWGSSLSPQPGKVVSTETVPCIDPAKLIATHNPTVIFSDIEGAELELFPALDLSSLRAVVMEVHPRVYGDKGVCSIFKAMHDKGFAYNKQSSGSVIVFQKM